MKIMLSALFAVLLMLHQTAQAQYPSKPIRLVVPFPPSGSADLTARIVAQPLAQALGTTIIIDNKGGADGAIAGNEVVRAAPDGYTLLFGTSTGLNAAPAMRKVPPYDPLADFTPIGMVGKFGFFVFVHESVPATSMAELIAYVRKNPGKLNYGTGNSTSVITTAEFTAREQLQMQHIPYKGDAPTTIDLVAGRIQLMIGTPGTVLPHVKEGKVRALAALLPARSPVLAEVPTMEEAGQKPMTVQPFAGLFGPAKLPREIVDRLQKELAGVLARPEVTEGVGRYAFQAQGSTSQQLADFNRAQYDIWRRTVRELGIQPD
jgi:tripartite-type tricarboxylate transporter receptor subunit TctC